MLEELKQKVFEANLSLVRYNLVIFTWGNVSEIDRKSGLVVIKPSGVEYDKMRASDMVVVNLDGEVVEGNLRPSSDTPTHLEIYKAFESVGGITHTHSTYATAFCQSGRSLTAYGTTHADYFYGDVPITRALTKEEIEKDYEKNTGKVIVEAFLDKDVLSTPAALVKSHGVFAFGKDANQSVYHAAVVEKVAQMAIYTELLNAKTERVDKNLLDLHYNRKHGKNAYYGQKENK